MNKELKFECVEMLRQYAEIMWFRSESEAAKGNKGRCEHYTKEYHRIHDIKKQLEQVETV